MVAEILAGIALAKTAVSGIKSAIDTAKDVNDTQYFVVGYKGSSPYDAGLFYCPYVPLQMVRAVGENTFQPKIGFKTRYGMAANPFAAAGAAAAGFPASGLNSDASLDANTNSYYRRVKVNNLM